MSVRLLRSPDEWLGRALQRGGALMERLGALPTGELPEEGLVRLPFALPDAAALAATYPTGSPAREALRTACEGIRGGRFDLLGHRALSLGVPPDWHADPLRQRRAPLAHWSRVPYLDPEIVGDHKLVWELNRHQWLVTLAQDHVLDPAPATLDLMRRLVDSWLAANPPKQGINWASSLELSFRAIAWLWVLHLTGDALPLPLRQRMIQGLDLHGQHLERYPSTWFSPNTHLTGEALGLLYLGTALPSLRAASRWRRLGWDTLCREFPRQVRDDGTHFEQASWYLGYTVDFYLHALVLARSAGLEVPTGYEERLRAAAGALAALMRDDGSLALIGDDDGGRLLPLATHPVTSFLDTLALAEHVLGPPGLPGAWTPPPAMVWLTGQPPAPRPKAADPETSLALPGGGWYLCRGQAHGHRLTAIVDAGPHGALAAGHGHADALAIDLAIDGQAVLADPGTCSYIGPARDRFRGTAVHSTLTIEGRGSAEPGEAFKWRSRPTTTVAAFACGPNHAWLDAAHDGWSRLWPGVRHRRRVLWLDGAGLVVVDSLPGAATPPGRIEVRWHIAPGLEVYHAGAHTAVIRRDGSPVLTMEVSRGTLRTEPATSSPCYGMERPSMILIHEPGFEAGKSESITLLVPGAVDRVGIMAANPAKEPGWQVELGEGTGQLHLSDERISWAWASSVTATPRSILELPLRGGLS